MVKNITVKGFRAINNCLKRARQFEDTRLKFYPIPLRKLALLTHTDASGPKQALEKGKPQAGQIVGFCETGIDSDDVAVVLVSALFLYGFEKRSLVLALTPNE